ncbi:hypothetical protein K438DRAFT_19121 [Mycena galopus ATCC 62051]|nr:hypothetical protein K438DRAFT_19121 [Mycena galopus ATCC 62051]
MISEIPIKARDIRDIREFPLELLAKIFKQLAYFDIIRASQVCRLWRGIVQSDPGIAELLYKRMCRFIADFSETMLPDGQAPYDPVTIHPALQIMTYTMGDELETAVIRNMSQDAKDMDPTQQREYQVIDLDVRNDFATRPTVTQVYVKAKGNKATNGMRRPFLAKVTNRAG